VYAGRNIAYVTMLKQKVLGASVVLRPAKKPDAF
jgi:hypothetical protein